VKIHLCCLDGLVPKPERDDQAINAAVEQFHGSAMSKYVWSDPFASHGGAMVLCHGSMLRDKVLDRVTAERPTAEAGKKGVLRLALLLAAMPLPLPQPHGEAACSALYVPFLRSERGRPFPGRCLGCEG